jgi:hypothetical protein
MMATTDHLAFKAHPLVPLPSGEEMARDMADASLNDKLMLFLDGRAKLLRAELEDPLNHGLRLPQSRMVDELLDRYQLVYESGGKRAGKTEDGIPRFLRGCMAYGKAKRWAMQDNALSSVANLQQTFWKYLPAWIKALNNKRSGTHRVHYSPQNGFDLTLILPNGCEIYFLNYTQNPQDFLGWELGKATDVPAVPGVPDIGALLDENCPLAWLENIQLRCSTRGAKIHWMYSPQDGITPAIKELKANARTLESRPAELLSDRVNVPGLPKGHMPLVQVDEAKHLAIFYRFTELNPFSGYSNPGGVRDLCLGKKDRNYTMAHAYGYCEAVRGRVFPLFGEWNVIKAADMPAEGTNWMVTDPATARNWYTLWVRCTHGGEIWAYREWPSYDGLGEWAVTSKNPRRLNGERGPAQTAVGYGAEEYRRLFARLERVPVPALVREGKVTEGLASVADPHHRLLIERAVKAEADLENVREEIFQRLIDPRASKTKSAMEAGAITLMAKLWQEVPGLPKMPFYDAPGLELRDGISLINELLFFRQDEQRVSIINEPKLWVSESCRNLIWALKTYSLPDDVERASDNACEDPIDCLRYLVTHGVRYIRPGGKVETQGGGCY